MRLEKTPLRWDVTSVIGCAIGLSSILACSKGSLTDMFCATMLSFVIGVKGTIAVLKHKGKIQIQQEAPENLKANLRVQFIVLACIGVAVLIMILRNTSK